MNTLYCPKCGSNDAMCVDERGWHIHFCRACGHEETFTRGNKVKPETQPTEGK